MIDKKIIKKYDNQINDFFKYNLIDKYRINFEFSNLQNYIILKNKSTININNSSIWCNFKIICSYDVKNKYIIWGKNMILLENSLKSEIYNSESNETYKNIKDIEEFIIDNINKKTLGIVKDTLNNIVIYYEILKIIKS